MCARCASSWPKRSSTTSSCSEDVWAGGHHDRGVQPAGQGAVPGAWKAARRVFDSRVIVEYLDTLSPVGKLIPPPGRERAEVKTWEALADGVLDAAILARLEATWAGRTDGAAQPGLDRPPAGQGASRPEGHEPGPGRQAVLQRHPPEPVRHRGRLRAGLAGLPFPADRLARRLLQPGQAAGQADAAPELHRHPAGLSRSALAVSLGGGPPQLKMLRNVPKRRRE